MVEDKDPPATPNVSETAAASRYWRDNLMVVTILMSIWFIVAFGGGVFGTQWLNQFKIGQLGLGFWIAQQGSILVFVLLVVTYAIWMDRIDRKHGVEEDQ